VEADGSRHLGRGLNLLVSYKAVRISWEQLYTAHSHGYTSVNCIVGFGRLIGQLETAAITRRRSSFREAVPTSAYRFMRGYTIGKMFTANF
jgi:hypothetical protein